MKPLTLNISLSSLILFLSLSSASAQTIIPQRPDQQAGARTQAAQQQRLNQIGQSSTLPVPQTMIDQAKAQINGQFPPMERQFTGGLIQEAWNDHEDQNAGIARLSYCRDCTYKVRLREFMVTAIQLPAYEVITNIDIGDHQAFDVQQRTPHIVAIKPRGFGMDSNLVIYTQHSQQPNQTNIYPFYLRAEAQNSQNITDLVVKIGNAGVTASMVPTLPIPNPQPSQVTPSILNAPSEVSPEIRQETIDAALAELSPASEPQDYIETVPFDPSKLHGFDDYTLWGNEGGEAMRPERIFRDNRFTYVQFGTRWDKIELTTAYVVIDEIDELVNSRVTGRTFIIESINPLITLKNGKSYLCIQYEGAA